MHVKICGVTSADDARGIVERGASAIGLNFVPGSKRCIDVPRAREISQAVRGKILVVGVVADLGLAAMQALVADAELGCLQLHGHEPPAALTPLLPHAYKAVRIGSAADVALARAYGGDYLLVDAKVEGTLGGTGAVFDWSLVRELAAERKLTLAGGLRPDNVAAAVEQVRPWSVDVAGGVESAPGVKDLALVEAFVREACR